jgi:FkbM family methyltransferase
MLAPNGSLQPLVFDVSSDGAFSYIWNRLHERGLLPLLSHKENYGRKDPNYIGLAATSMAAAAAAVAAVNDDASSTVLPTPPPAAARASFGTVVEIGGGSGIMGSNAFNFVQLGWRALIVEPLPANVSILRRELRIYAPRVTVAECALGEDNALNTGNQIRTVPLYVFSSASKTSNCIGCDPEEVLRRQAHMHTSYSRVDVALRSVAALFSQHMLPRHFEVLSIDAEGRDVAVLRETFAAGYRPLMIIVEMMVLRNKSEARSISEMETAFSAHGYRRAVGFTHGASPNEIWELVDHELAFLTR